MKPFEKDVSSQYGAPMGRRSDSPANLEGRKTHLWRVPFYDGDYDKGGAYWGGGRDSEPLYCAHSDAEWQENEQCDKEPVTYYFRAKTREQAKAHLKELGARVIR